MLQQFNFTFICTTEGSTTILGGVELHGLFFKLLSEYDLAVATELHHQNNKPFSISPLNGVASVNSGKLYLKAGETYTFQLSTLEKWLGELIKSLSHIWHGKTMTLGSAKIVGLTIEETISTSYLELINNGSLNREITFIFKSPTTFRSQGTHLLFPEPKLLFTSMFIKFNVFSPLKLQQITDFSNINVSRYRLETKLIDMQKYKLLGFVGRCSYQLPKQMNKFVIKQINTLAQFAQYSGVGYRCTWGMGNVELNYGKRKRKEGKS